jgi:FixJ family two-component response regulator
LRERLAISVIDDDAPVLRATIALLRALGHEPLGFDSAASFLSQYGARRDDCIVADIHMPGMTGIELRRILRARGDATPLVLVTGAARPHLGRQALQAGVVDILKKPFGADALLHAILHAVATTSPLASSASPDGSASMASPAIEDGSASMASPDTEEGSASVGSSAMADGAASTATSITADRSASACGRA